MTLTELKAHKAELEKLIPILNDYYGAMDGVDLEDRLWNEIGIGKYHWRNGKKFEIIGVLEMKISVARVKIARKEAKKARKAALTRLKAGTATEADNEIIASYIESLEEEI